MNDFRKLKDFFLLETIRMHGLGDSTESPCCALCQVSLSGATRFFRCSDCGTFLQCLDCCLQRHALTPLHLLKEWNGQWWDETDLGTLGLVYQLGHDGQRCTHPAGTVRTMVVMDVAAIHTVKYRYCACHQSEQTDNLRQLMRNGWFPATTTDPATCATFNALDFFRLLNVLGNINAHDFVRALEQNTRAISRSGYKPLPDRYKAFMRMARQYAFLQQMRRSGRGHDSAGLAATKLGECTVMCWACPQDGRNLPENWRDVSPKYRFLFMLLIAVDANFKLKNRLRANEHQDDPLGPGWGAFVEPNAYREHLRGYVAEKDISTCIAFAALLQKDTRNTTGLRCSGVGGVVCTRHECVRPNGLGDLQKGERYANMDYIVMSSLAGFSLSTLTISYDIACQWQTNLQPRMKKLPEQIQLDLKKVEVQCALPVWHASSHEKSCQDKNSLSFAYGVGKSDGEGVERVWSVFNGMANHTKDAGIGNRADAVEDKVNMHNYSKNLGQGDALRRKLVVAIAERSRQVEAFAEINRTIESTVKEEWQAQVDAFMADRTKPNPFARSRDDGPTEVEIRLALKKEEEELARKTGAPLHGTSMTAFIVAGLQLEESQRRIRAEVAGLTLLTADREAKLHDYRIAFLVKLKKFRDMQKVFTPVVMRLLDAEDAARDPDAPPMAAENIKLWLPSELDKEDRPTGCAAGVVEVELRLREGQCANALVAIRARLHAKRHILNFRDAGYASGQKKATKAQSLIGILGDRAEALAKKYRQARLALSRLKGLDYAPHFRELRDADLTLDGEEEESASDIRSRKKLAMLAAGKGGRVPRHISGTSKRTLSWIWSAHGALDDAEKHLHELLRVEWTRAKARKVRWEEEVLMLREEMRRVLRYLEWQATLWDARRESRQDMVDLELRGGLRAYAAKQAAMHREIGVFFKTQWGSSAGEIVRSLVEEDGADLASFFE
ncbi:hypothetical protein B0H11DRAFT_2234793 [Mycena galericulata]|nr:hypothetical protein B0H11DRAFT_2234793 [Mycena galericulata]